MENGQKILIVDDRADNLYALEKVLGETGAEIVKAENGNEALTASLNHDFALAILDVQMPGMDGYELAELLRNKERTNRLPIIFLSAVYSDEYHVFRGYEAGAVDFITKPYDPKVLISKVKVFLQLDRQRMELIEKVEIESSQRYLESILMSMADPVIVVSPEGRIQNINKAALVLSGYEKETDLLGTPIHQWFDPMEESGCMLSDSVGCEPQNFHNREVVFRARASVRVPALLSGSALKDINGKPLGNRASHQGHHGPKTDGRAAERLHAQAREEQPGAPGVRGRCLSRSPGAAPQDQGVRRSPLFEARQEPQ